MDRKRYRVRSDADHPWRLPVLAVLARLEKEVHASPRIGRAALRFTEEARAAETRSQLVEQVVQTIEILVSRHQAIARA